MLTSGSLKLQCSQARSSKQKYFSAVNADANVIYTSNDKSNGGTATRTIASASLDAAATGGFFATQDLLIVDVPLVDRLDFEPVLGSTGWELLTVEQTIGTDELFSWIRILTPNRPTLKRLHLLAHGQPGILQLGTGITPNALVQLARQLEPFGIEVVVWGCSVGAGANNTQSSCTNLLCSDHPLGQGRTLKGYGPLSKLVKDASFSLFIPTETIEFNTPTGVTDRFPLEGILLEKDGTKKISVAFYKSHPDYNYKDIIIVRSAKSWVGESLLNGLFAGLEPNRGISTTAQIIFSQETNSAGAPVWFVQDWIVNGRLNINAAGISSNANGSIRYQNKNAAFDNHSTYSITSGTVSLNSSATANLFSGSATASLSDTTPLVLKQVTAADGSASWQAQGWKANGTVDIAAGGITAKANADVTYKAKDASYDNQATYTISSASLSADASGKVFSANVSATDVVLKQIQDADPKNPNSTINTWQAQGWKANGTVSIKLEDATTLSGSGTVSFKKEIAGDTYTITDAGLSLTLDGSVLAVQADRVVVKGGKVVELTGSATADNLAGIKNAKLTISTQGGNINLNGSGSYEDVDATFKGTLGTDLNNKLALETLESSLTFKDSVNLDSLQELSVNGRYSKAKGISFGGSATFDLTPDETKSKDRFAVSLSDVKIQQGVFTSGKLSATSKDVQFAIGGASLSPKSIEINYKDNRFEDQRGDLSKFTKSIGLNIEAAANWGSQTKETNDDLILDLSGNATYSNTYNSQTNQKISGGLTDFTATVIGNGNIDLGPVVLKPKDARVSYAADLDQKYALWNINGDVVLGIDYIGDVGLSLGDSKTEARTSLDKILQTGDKRTYPTGGWSLGNISGSLNGENGAPLIDIGLARVNGVTVAIDQGAAGNPDDPLSKLGFYNFVDNNSLAVNDNKVLTQNQGRSIKLQLKDVEVNSGKLVSALKDTAETVEYVLSPVRPVVDFFTQEVTVFNGIDQALKSPVISFLESTPNNKYKDGKVQAVEFVDVALAAKSLLSGEEAISITPAVKAAENVFTVIDQLKKIDAENGNEYTSLGDFSFSYDLNSVAPGAANTKAQVVPQPQPSTDNNSPTSLTKAKDVLSRQIDSAKNPPQSNKFTSNTSISLPVLSDPKNFIAQYFSTGQADVFDINIDLGFAQQFGASVPVPAFPMVKVGIEGGVDANIKTTIKSSLSASDITALKDDFSVAGLSSALLKGSSIDLSKTKASFGANIGLSVGVDAYIASLKLVGGLAGRLSVQPVLMEGNKQSNNQLINLGGNGLEVKPAFNQTSTRLVDLDLIIEQNLDNVIRPGETRAEAYKRATWLLTIKINPIANISERINNKLPHGINQIRLIEIDKNVMQSSATNDYKSVKLDLGQLNNKDSAIFKAFKSALTEQLKLDYKEDFTDTEIALILKTFSKAAPTSIEYATIDTSTQDKKDSRKEFLHKNNAIVMIDGTAPAAQTNANTQLITYYNEADNTITTEAFYAAQYSKLNEKEPELAVAINAKLTQPFNSVFFDIVLTDQRQVSPISQPEHITIKFKDDKGIWRSIGNLHYKRGKGKEQFTLESPLKDSGVEVRLVPPKDGGEQKLVINISNGNAQKSNIDAKEIIKAAEEGRLQIGFDIVSGSAKTIAISSPRIVQGGAVSTGLESSITSSKLLTNALGNLDNNGNLVDDQLREFALIAQLTDILNPVEFSIGRKEFGGIPNTVVDISNYGLNFEIDKAPQNRYDSLAVVNSINRTAINDQLSKEVIVKQGTATRQTVDPVSGDTYLSYIDISGNLAIALRNQNTSKYQLLRKLTILESANFKDKNNAPDIVAYNGQVMAAGAANDPGKIARYLLRNTGDITNSKYLLEIDRSAPLYGTNTGNIRIGLIAERDAASNNTSSDELTVALAYTTDSEDKGNAIVHRNKNLKASNTTVVPSVINLDLSANFSSWQDEKGIFFGESVVAVDFMEFGTIDDLRSKLAAKNASTVFSLEGTISDLKIWNAASTDSRKQEYPLNIPGLTPTDISIVYTKQAGKDDSVPAFINNWKGTINNENRRTSWSVLNDEESKNVAIVVTGKAVDGNPKTLAGYNSFHNNSGKDEAYSNLMELKSARHRGVDAVYLYSPYNDILSANVAPLILTSYTTNSDSDVARQNVDNSSGGLVWDWSPILGKKDNLKSNVDTNANVNSEGYLKYGGSTLVALAQSGGEFSVGSAVGDIQSTAKNNKIFLSKNTFQILPRATTGTYALSAFSDLGKIVSVDQLPNYETGILTTKTVFDVPNDYTSLANAYFDGSYSFVDQAEWAPLGIVSAKDAVYIGDLRAPAIYRRPDGNKYAVPQKLQGARSLIDVGQSEFKTNQDLAIVLEAGTQLSSPNAKYTLDMQLNGELILYENTLNGRSVLYNINEFIYQEGRKKIVEGYGRGLPNVANVPGTKLVIKQAPTTKSGNNPGGRYVALAVPAESNGNNFKYIPLNPDKNYADNINYIFNTPDGRKELNYEWRTKNGYDMSVVNTGNFFDIFGRLVLTNDGDLIAYDNDRNNPDTLFKLQNWKRVSVNGKPSYGDIEEDVATLTDATPYGFNGLISDIVRENKDNKTANTDIDKAYWISLMSENPSIKSGYDVLRVSPDLLSSFNDIENPRDVVLTGTGDFTGLLSKRDGTFTDISSAITWGKSAEAANQIKSIRFTTDVNLSSESSLEKFLEERWKNISNTQSSDYSLLNAAVPINANSTWQDWLNSFKKKYSSLQALSVLPAFTNGSFMSVPTIELTPRVADISSVYKTYVEQVASNRTINLDINFKLDAFVKIVGSFLWYNKELLNYKYPIFNETWTLKTGYSAGGPVYGKQIIFLDQNRNLSADVSEIASINSDASFSLDLSPIANKIIIGQESSLNRVWDGLNYIFSPLSGGVDFRSGLLIVKPSSEGSVFDTATGLANNKIYITLPDTQYLIANIWTSIKYSPALDYKFFPEDATKAASEDFLKGNKLRFSNDPYFVAKLTPLSIEKLLTKYLAGIPDAYSTKAGDTFDTYNGIVASDPEVANQAFEAFRFTSRLTITLEVVERLLNRLKPDIANSGQSDSFLEHRDLISAYQLIPYLAMTVDGQLDPYYTNALKVAANQQIDILSSIEAKTFKLDLTDVNHIHMLLRFACLTIPTYLGLEKTLFNSQGQLNLDDPNLSTRLQAQQLGLAQVARDLAFLTTAYDVKAQALFNSDPRLVTSLLAPAKRSILEAGGIIDRILNALPSANLGNELQKWDAASNRNRPELQDNTRIASITEALENDFDDNGNPVQHAALRISLNHAAPPGGTIVPLTYSGPAVYGTDYQFEGNTQRPGYAFVPFGNTSVVVPIIQPKTSARDWAIAIGIEDPSCSYNSSADINRVLVRYHASTGKISLYDNNVLVRLSNDPAVSRKLISASPEDKTFDYNFYTNSRVVGIEAVSENGLLATPLHHYVSNLDGQISIYATKMPATLPINDGQWLLDNGNVMAVYEGDSGSNDIIQLYNADTGRYGYAPAGEISPTYQGSSWQNQGIVFSLRQFNRENVEAIGTIMPITSVGTRFQSYPERTSLPAGTLTKIKAYGLSEEQINSSFLRMRPQLEAHQQGRASVVMDLAALADRLWQPGSGISETFAALFKVRSNGEVAGLADAKTGAGARLYSLHSSNGSLDTVVFEYVDGVTDDDPDNNTLDITAAAGFTATFAPTLQAKDGIFQFVDSSKSDTPVIGALQITLRSGSDVVQDLRYAVLEATESLQVLTKAELIDRSRLLISSLEKTDVTALPSQAAGVDYRQTLSLINGQKLVLLEKSDRDPNSPIQVLSIPSSLTNGTIQSFTTPGGVFVDLQVTSDVPLLQEFLSRDQQLAPVFNFTGLNGQSVRFDVEVSREADYNSIIGFYRVLDAQGAVRDAVTGAVLEPGDAGYAKAALNSTNLPNLRQFTLADDQTDTFTALNLSEPGCIAPYALVNGNTLFAFGAANPDGRSHFKVISQNVFGYEDTVGTSNGLVDFDDMLIAVRNPVLVA